MRTVKNRIAGPLSGSGILTLAPPSFFQAIRKNLIGLKSAFSKNPAGKNFSLEPCQLERYQYLKRKVAYAKENGFTEMYRGYSILLKAEFGE